MFRIKYSREIILKLLYKADVLDSESPIDARTLLDQNAVFFKGINPKEKEFILNVVQKVLNESEKIDQMLSKNLIGWKLKRLLPVDRCLLRLGVGESYFNDQKAVIIDDVIRLAKKYGSEESYKIINAVLDKVIR